MGGEAAPPSSSSSPSARRYDRLFRNIFHGYAYCRMCFDDAGRPVDFEYLEVNESFVRITGLEDVTGRLVSEVLPGVLEAEPQLFEIYGRVARDGRPESFDIKFSPLGRWLRVAAYRPEPGHFVALFDDITARERAELAARESEARYRMIAENTSDGILCMGADARILYASPAYARQVGCDLETIVQRTPDAIYSLVHPDDRDALFRDIYAAIAAKRVHYSYTYRTRHAAGHYIWREDNAQFQYDDSSARNYLGCVVVCRDITARKQVEDERAALERQLQQAQRLESIGRLAGGIAHDFNNLLTVILACAEELEQDVAAGVAPNPDSVTEIAAAGIRARDLTRQLLAYSRRQVVKPVALDLNEVVRGTHKMLSRLLGEDIELRVSLQDGLSSTFADPGQIEQILVNLAVNSRDAMPRGGTLAIETCDAHCDRAPAPEPPGGRWVRLRVRDSGTGMPPEVVAHAFEPFFTTREVGKGTGLGLATVHGIVAQVGGHIHLETAPGQGATFEICLPRSELAAATSEPRRTTRARGGHETILVVEDDPHVRRMAVRALRAGGHRVLEAASALEALAAVAIEPSPPPLVVSDLVLPGGEGRALVEDLRRLHGPMRALFVSGYPPEVIRRHGVLESGADFLPKPFTGDALLARVRELLDRDQPPSSLGRSVGTGGASPEAGAGSEGSW